MIRQANRRERQKSTKLCLKMESKACQEIESRVIKNNLCTLCGACVGMCPYLVVYKGKVILRDVCDLSEGRCYAFCPRASVDLDSISQSIFGVPYAWDELGTVQQVFMARSADATLRARAQSGGVVTALTCFALDQGLIDSAILTLSQDKSLPTGIITSTKEEVIKCAGSSYVATPTLEAFNRGAQDDSRKRIGVVGTPCQVLAIAKMRTSTLDNRNNIDKLNLVIGLFCTWAFSHDGFASFLAKKIPPSDIVKLDIPPPPANIFEVYTTSQRISFSLDEVRSFIKQACTYCIDMTAEFADISVGTVEGLSGWNTIIVRSDTSNNLIKAAEAKAVIEIDTLPTQNLDHLKQSSRLKKKRALENIIQSTGRVDDLLYLKAQPEMITHLVEDETEGRFEDA